MHWARVACLPSTFIENLRGHLWNVGNKQGDPGLFLQSSLKGLSTSKPSPSLCPPRPSYPAGICRTYAAGTQWFTSTRSEIYQTLELRVGTAFTWHVMRAQFAFEWMDNPERSQFLFSGGHVLTFILLESHNCVQQANSFSYLGVHFAAHSTQEEMRVAVPPVVEAARACSEVSYEYGEPQGTLAQKTF